jgi:PAS domain S-box-containing protein
MNTFPRWWKAILALAVILLLAGGGWYYRMQQQHSLKQVIASLETTSQLKVSQLVAWRSALMREATAMMRSPYYINVANQWKDGPRPEDRGGILSRLQTAKDNYLYRDVLYVGVEGKVYLSLNNTPVSVHEMSLQALAEAFRTGKRVMTDLYLPSGGSNPQLDVVMPFYAGNVNPPVPVCAFIFQYDAPRFLYPIIQFWPVPSRTAETLLVRRDGDSVLYVSELRHKKGGALTARVPLSRRDVPAVQAVLGQRGLVRGRDYRDVKVISFVEAVPDTGWIMISKIDEDEAFTEVRRDLILLLTLLLFLIALMSTVMGVLWQRNQKAHYRALFEMEAEQRKSEALYRKALDGIREGCLIVGFDWRLIYANATAQTHSGRSKEELLSHTLMECFPGVENTEIFAFYRRCMSERTPQHVINSAKYPDGTNKWFETSVQPISEGIFILINDITERKQAEESLRESEGQYRTLFEHMIQGAFRMRADGSFRDVNPAALTMAGMTREEFLSKNATDKSWDFIREDGTPLPVSEAPPLRALRTGIPAHAVQGFWNPHTNSRLWIEVTAIPEFMEGEKRPYQVLVTLHNITDWKQAEAEHDRLVSAIEQSNECVVIIDRNKVVQYVNPVFEKMTGKKREEAVGQPLPMTEHQNESFYREFWATLESGKSWQGRLINVKKDGTLYTEDATVSPVFDSAGAIVNFVSVTRNITEYLHLREEKEKLQMQFLQAQKMESVGRLAGGVAHDFNNMLNVISGHAQLAMEKIDTVHPLYHHLQEISEAAQRSADLTRQLLAFARRQAVAPKVLNLNNTVAGLLNMLQWLIGEDIVLAWMPGHNLWPVRIDPAQVDQILANLAVNARDAIDKQGKITIETENVVFDEEYCLQHQDLIPGEYVMMALSDDGSGMGKDVLEHLFEPFFTTKKMGQGTGLGLATVYGIVKQNDGFVDVYSEPGRGSTFKIYFPRHAGPEAAGKTDARIEMPKGGTETILLVEDEEAVLNLAKVMLERLGYKVIAAQNPSEAIRISEEYKENIHLLLVDVIMPEMTGRDLAERLTHLRPDLRTLFMSGYTADVIAHRGVLDEGVFFVQKPFSTRDLADKLREVMESKA